MGKNARWLGWGFGVGLGAVVALIACSGPGGPGAGGKGLCSGSCPKTCDKDADCPTGAQLCCDFGAKGKACTAPQDCYPARFCTDDSKCNTQNGETCCPANLGALSQKVCVPANACKKPCAVDNDCAGTPTPKCCTALAHPICTAADVCPNTCSTSTDCNTSANETCCTTAKDYLAKAGYPDALAPNVHGLCLSPQVASSCPKTCTQSTDCNTNAGELCCNGTCSTSCDKTCDSNNDCDTSKGQFCCMASALASPWWAFKPSVNPVNNPPPNGSCSAPFCPNDPPNSALVAQCNQAQASKCASQFNSYWSCIRAQAMCTANGTTDQAAWAMAVQANCAQAQQAWTSCQQNVQPNPCPTANGITTCTRSADCPAASPQCCTQSNQCGTQCAGACMTNCNGPAGLTPCN